MVQRFSAFQTNLIGQGAPIRRYWMWCGASFGALTGFCLGWQRSRGLLKGLVKPDELVETKKQQTAVE